MECAQSGHKTDSDSQSALALKWELTCLQFEQLPAATLLAFLLGAVVAVVAMASAPLQDVVLWYAALAGVSVARYVLRKRFRKVGTHERLDLWRCEASGSAPRCWVRATRLSSTSDSEASAAEKAERERRQVDHP